VLAYAQKPFLLLISHFQYVKELISNKFETCRCVGLEPNDLPEQITS